MKGNCKVCNSYDELHKHHILPKAAGGLDTSENLIQVCLECHSKYHDRPIFSSSDLTKKGLKKYKDDYNVAVNYFSDNDTELDNMFNYLLDIDPDLHITVCYLLAQEVLNVSDLYKFWILKEPLRVKSTKPLCYYN